jgi:hypothetical protein
MTKNITLAIDESLLDKVRVIAAERKTTVNQLVRLHLEQIVRNEDRAKRAIADLRRMSLATKARLGPGFALDRAATYER